MAIGTLKAIPEWQELQDIKNKCRNEGRTEGLKELMDMLINNDVVALQEEVRKGTLKEANVKGILSLLRKGSSRGVEGESCSSQR